MNFLANPIYQSVSSKTLAHVQHCQSPQRKISSNSQRTDFQIVPLVCLHYTATSNAEEAEVEQFYEDLQDLLELTHTKNVFFTIGDWNAKVGSQETPGVTSKFGLGVQTEAGQRLIESCQENTLVIANTLCQQHKTRLYTWTSPDGRHWNQTDYVLCSQRWRGSIQSAKTRPGAQIMNSLLPPSDWNWRKWRKPLDHSGMT